MKLRDEVNTKWGRNIKDEDIVSESDDAFITKWGEGWSRNTETLWRNRNTTEDHRLTNPKPESLAKFVSGLQLDDDDL